MKKRSLITWVLFFLTFFFFLQLFNKKEAPNPQLNQTGIGVVTSKSKYSAGDEVGVKIKNNTAAAITIPSNCPANPLRVFRFKEAGFEEITAQTVINCSELAPDITLTPGQEKTVNYTYWAHSLFGEAGRYKIELSLPGDGTSTFSSPEFTVSEVGFWKKFFRTIFYQPLYNTLVLFIKIAPINDLGFAIILLTLLIRFILLVPSQHAIESQRKMQELQPKLEAVKKKYAGNQERIAQETMRLWKENRVNPFGSCLPIVIQFPILIALFYVIRNGLNPDNAYLLYSPLKNVDLSRINTDFLGILELTKINTFVLPLIVGALQFFQLKLAILKKKPAQETQGTPAKGSEMETVNKSMTYIMPVMIAIFTVSVPAGVGLYWGISTLFAIVQQAVSNRKAAVHTQ